MYSPGDKIDFLRRVFGTVDQYNDGNVQVRCPKRDCLSHSRKRKLAINIDRGDIFKCWVCEYKGRLFWLLKDHNPNYLPEYIKRFCDENSIQEVDKALEPLELPSDFRLLATSTNSRNPEVKRALRYLERRGINKRDLWYFKFGISNEGRFDNRVIMPSFDSRGEFNFYAARNLLSYGIKYMLPKRSKREVIFNEINIDWTKELTIVEGQFDLCKCNQNATCLSGSEMSDDSLLLVKIVQNNTPVLLAMDKDMKYTKAPRIAKMLMSFGIDVRVLILTDHEDVGEMTKKEFKELSKEARHWDRTDALRQRIRGLV